MMLHPVMSNLLCSLCYVFKLRFKNAILFGLKDTKLGNRHENFAMDILHPIE